MLDQYTESTKGPDGEPGVVIAHVEANVHLHRTLTKIREAGAPCRTRTLPACCLAPGALPWCRSLMQW